MAADTELRRWVSASTTSRWVGLLTVPAAFVALIGAFRPWFGVAFSEHTASGRFVGAGTLREADPVGAWSDGRLGLLIVPVLLVVAALAVRFWYGYRIPPHDASVRSAQVLGWSGVAAGVVSAGLLTYAWAVAPGHLSIGREGSSWAQFRVQGVAEGYLEQLSRDVRSGFVLSLVAAAVSLAAGVVVLLLQRGRQRLAG